jgi:hypothetical protein
MNIQEYLKYYLGTEVKCEVGKLDNTMESIITSIEVAHLHRNVYDYRKPLLRPLSDMSEEEARECGFKGTGYIHDRFRNMGDSNAIGFQPKDFHNFLSRGFDIFGLIEKGLALDATVKNKNQ